MRSPKVCALQQVGPRPEMSLTVDRMEDQSMGKEQPNIKSGETVG